MTNDRMILRTVYLTPELDNKLRTEVFQTNATRGDIISSALELWFEKGVKPSKAIVTKRGNAQQLRALTHTIANDAKILADRVVELEELLRKQS